MGELSDASTGSQVIVVGNLPTASDTDWYRVRLVDAPDVGTTACDAMAFVAELTDNPGQAFRLNVILGTDVGVNCSTGPACSSDGKYEWYTDMRDTTSGTAVGECPCSSTVVTLPNTTRDENGDGVVDGYDPTRPGGVTSEPAGTVHLGSSTANACLNDTRYVVVGVSRNPSVAVTCASYQLTLSNAKSVHH